MMIINLTLEVNMDVPANHSGIDGNIDIFQVRTATQVIDKIKRKGYSCSFNCLNKTITILDSSKLSESTIMQILKPEPNQHMNSYPILNKERNEDGDLQITLSGPIPPRTVPLVLYNDWASASSSSIEELTEKLYRMRLLETYSATTDVRTPSISNDERAAMELSICLSVNKTMEQIRDSRAIAEGIWHPDEYRDFTIDSFNSEKGNYYPTGYADGKFWEITERNVFRLQPGIKPSEALQKFLEGPTVADCGVTTAVCYYKWICDYLGEEKFDKIFGSEPFALTIAPYGILDLRSPISYLADFTEASKKFEKGELGKRPLKIGEECHFKGVNWYSSKHPLGSANGWNVIYIGDNSKGNQLFMGLGFEKPLTESEIYQKCINCYNKERAPQDEEYIAQAKEPQLFDKELNESLNAHYTISDAEMGLNLDKFIGGFLTGSGKGFLLERLIELKNSEKPNTLLALWAGKRHLGES